MPLSFLGVSLSLSASVPALTAGQTTVVGQVGAGNGAAVFKNGVALASSAFTVDASGNVTITTSPLAAGDQITVAPVKTGSGTTATVPGYAALAISGTPPAATTGTAYTFTPTVTGGAGAKSFSFAGSLPTAFSVSSTTGAITGLTAQTGTFSGSLTVTDGAGNQATLAVSILSSAPTFTPPAAFHNVNAAYLPNWKAARNGTASLSLAAIGDSTVEGQGASAGNTANYRNSWLGQLVAKFAATSPTFAADLSFASGNAAFPNDKLVMGGWSRNAGMLLGGGAGKTLQLTADNSFDRADVTYLGWTNTTGAFTVSADAAATVLTQNTTNDGAEHKVTISFADGMHNVLNITDTGAGTVYITGIRLWSSQTKRITLMNRGVSGAASTSLVSNGVFSISGQAKADAPVLTLVEGGLINDYKSNIALSATQANLQTMITNAKATGDCIVVIPNFDGTTAANTQGLIQSDYNTAAENLAASNNCVIYRVYEKLGAPWTAANASGYMFDADHPNATGYGLIATDIANFLAGI